MVPLPTYAPAHTRPRLAIPTRNAICRDAAADWNAVVKLPAK